MHFYAYCLSYEQAKGQVKGNDVPVHAMKAYQTISGIVPFILNLHTRWRCLVNFTPWQLYCQERVPGTHGIEGQVGPRAGLDILKKTKISCPCQEFDPVSPSCRLVIIVTLLFAQIF
jgi:hypothetical protein